MESTDTPITPQRAQLLGQLAAERALVALAHDLILVTRNTREFDRVPELRVENWYE